MAVVSSRRQAAGARKDGVNVGGQFAPGRVADPVAGAGAGLSLDDAPDATADVHDPVTGGDTVDHYRDMQDRQAEINAVRLAAAGYDGDGEWAEPPPDGVWEAGVSKVSDVGRHRVWHRSLDRDDPYYDIKDPVTILECERLSNPGAVPDYVVMYGYSNSYDFYALGSYPSAEDAVSAADRDTPWGRKIAAIEQKSERERAKRERRELRRQTRAARRADRRASRGR